MKLTKRLVYMVALITMINIGCQQNTAKEPNSTPDYTEQNTPNARPIDYEEAPQQGQEQNLILTAEGERYVLDLQSIGFDGFHLSSIDQDKLKSWLRDVKEKVDQSPKNASLDRYGEDIKPATSGKMMDLQQIDEWLGDLGYYINQPLEIPFVEVPAAVNQRDLARVDQKLIGSYQTTFNGNNSNRTTNIKLSAKAIDKLILMPGEVFSFNQVVGERTAEKGYQSAPIIVKGEYSEGIGGGICQVSSTLYNSVNEAGLKIVNRYSHSKEVTYVPPGQDATVSWGGPDFQFQNTLQEPILLRVKVNSDSISVRTYTTPEAKVTQRTVPDPPKQVEQYKVNPDQPTHDLPQNQIIAP
ncbi:VanW family protein [Risungbinella massiliensis]|uniref:VanW family protein n=1 Tax=Risungbinella massiliensis TaxID=1329796 RepID=UPI00069A515B|nr:VanW family protein [Risungbinella massiliensis]